jgi:hypothetical protein
MVFNELLGQIAQLVEQRTENPRVDSSILSLATTSWRKKMNIDFPRIVLISVIFALILAIGNIFGSSFIGNGLSRFKTQDNFVSVKGIAERKEKADLAIWRIGFKAAGNDLTEVSNKIAEDQKSILNFLAKQAIEPSEIERQQTTIVDQYAVEYGAEKPKNRYIITSALQVKTNKVDLIYKVSNATQELISQGIVLDKDYNVNPRFIYTQLESIRPQMLEEATKSARNLAMQFAKNSGSTLGAIKHANQGVFLILGADASMNQTSDANEESSVYKKIRVVSSIDYYLK